jgi:hypothetical protein
MATITEAPRLSPAPDRIRHPLQKLRGYIRYYVTLEGLGVTLLFLALWFWIGLFIDYGFFKVFGVDFVQELPWGLRAGVLFVVVAALIAVVGLKVAWRLFREFNDPAVAMVLERRFPEQLGDRLITAVELADVRKAATYGYSPAMIEQTIQEASERVEPLPVQEVFDWKRLQRMGYLLALVTIGVWVVVGFGTGTVNKIADGEWQLGSFVPRFKDVSGIWFERNVLLQNTIWPRKAHLELLGFPENGELKIGRDAPAPGIRVRAFKWVIADSATAEGWRPVKWKEIDTTLVGGDLPHVELPADWRPRDADYGWTLDEVELNLDKPEVHKSLSPESHEHLRDLLQRLDDRAADPTMSRKLRKLTIPDTVYVVYKSATMRNEMTLQKQGDNEYAGVFSDLKETIRFYARGEDYTTPERRIIVVPPPSLVSLTREEDRPAYLFYRVPQGGTVADLRGKKLHFSARDVTLTGEKSPIGVPAGTDVLLTGKTDKELVSVRTLPARKGAAEVNADIKLDNDHQTFHTQFLNVRGTIDLVFEFTDTDNVIGLRHTVIEPTPDGVPVLEVQPDVIRKTNQGYMATLAALIPFTGKVRDDNGLDQVEYYYTISRVDPSANRGGSLLALLGGTAQLFGGPDYVLPTALFITSMAHDAQAAGAADKKEEGPLKAALPSFAKVLQGRVEREVPINAETLAKLLKEEAPRTQLTNAFDLDPEDPQSAFDVERVPMKLKVDSSSELQPRYKMQLWVVATDNDIETGPHTGATREKFTFLLVSEYELLAEIAKEEESLHIKLDDTVKRLTETRAKLEQVNTGLAGMPKTDEFSPFQVRSEEVEQVRDKAQSAATEVFNDYTRILKELKANRVEKTVIDKVDHLICEPLDLAIRGDFPKTQEALDELRKQLETNEPDLMKKTAASREAGLAAHRQLSQLIDRLNTVLNSMEGLATVNKAIQIIQAIRDEEQKQFEQIQKIQQKFQEEILKSITGDDKPPEKKDEKPPVKKKDEKKP